MGKGGDRQIPASRSIQSKIPKEETNELVQNDEKERN